MDHLQRLARSENLLQRFEAVNDILPFLESVTKETLRNEWLKVVLLVSPSNENQVLTVLFLCVLVIHFESSGISVV